ncbi:uncharacterized protein LOC141689305 [Apium graveolens]|uniref:uncharacterized protein LOC141689305 n=1 Tax=Apium graveolens TaxID=4045 RepID=UPI003D7A4CAF
MAEFRAGFGVFLDYAYGHPKYVKEKNQIQCPCWKCKTNNYVDRDMVNYHLLVNGFMRNYEECWWAYGQKRDGSFTSNYSGSSSTYHMDEMVHDIAGQDFDWDQAREQPMNSDAKAFTKLLEEGREPLWYGCTKHTKLSGVTTLLNIKADHNISHEYFESLLKAIKSMLPDNEKLPDNFYYYKKMVKKLGLGYQKIDACPNGYRLKRLYMSSRPAEHMSWHAKSSAKDGELNHPTDGQAWKNFNKTHPRFTSEPRNVRLGLSTDGFNPFGHSAVPYSCWPVIVTPYNPPPWMCMKQPYMFLSLMIPGPTSPGKNLDVYLRPLIDELKVLWKDGIQTWDVSTQTNFNLRATLLWTISDFPAYGKTKGNDKARLDLKDICKRPALELRQSFNGKTVKPHARYTLSKKQVEDVCTWIKSLKLPDGYASNIARCATDKTPHGKLKGMKSHDCHVFLERVLPIAFRD